MEVQFMDQDENLVVEKESQDEEQKDTQKNQDQVNIDMSQIKNETTQTAKQVTDTLKTMDLKKDVQMTKGFLLKSWKTPIAAIKEVSDNAVSYSKVAIFLLIAWMVAEAIYPLLTNIRYYGFKILTNNFLDTLLSMVKSGLAPLLVIVVLSIIIMIFQKEKKNSLMTIMTVITIAQAPRIFSNILHLLNHIDSNASRLLTPISNLCFVLSIVFLYFGVRFLLNENDDEKQTNRFILIYAVYYLVSIAFNFFGIWI